MGLRGGSRLATELMRATLTGQGHRDHAKGMDNSQLFTVYSLPPQPRYLSTYFTKQNSRQSRTFVALLRNISASAILYTSEYDFTVLSSQDETFVPLACTSAVYTILPI